MTQAPVGGELFQVRMLQVPLLLRERSRQQGADLLREMTLVRAGLPPADGTPASGLLQLAEELELVYGPYIAGSTQEMDAALDRGEDVVAEVVYWIPEIATAFMEHVRAVLARVEEYCRSDAYLLTLAPDPDIAGYRDWSIGEVLRQRGGLAPVPWPQYASQHGLT